MKLRSRLDYVKARILTGTKFSGGLDINLMQNIQNTGNFSSIVDDSRDLVLNAIEDGKKPSIAAIQGYALGIGMPCTYYHGRNSTWFARAETRSYSRTWRPNKQLINGYYFSGTQRLPRLVGVPKAVEMMLSYEPITCQEGKNVGLIDAIVSPEELLEVSRLWALDIAEGRRPRINTLHISDKLGSLPEACDTLNTARQRVMKIASNMPQQRAAWMLLKGALFLDVILVFLKEEKIFKELVLSSTGKGLVHVYFAQRAISKLPGIIDAGLKPRQIRKVGVIGAGLMGSCIAAALIMGNIHVVLKEINLDYLQKGIKKIEANLQGLATKGKFELNRVERALSNLKGGINYSDFKDADMVIEAVNEEESLKQSIFEDIEKVCPAHCIFASGTSGIDLNIIGKNTSSQDRIVGAHFFSPAHVMPLLEIVRTEKTSKQVIILDVMTVGKTIKKVPIVVGNCTGFAVNRTFFPYVLEAYMLADLGVDIFRIDRVITEFGMPMGPFQLHDITGYGIAIAFGKEHATAFPDRTYQSSLLQLMIKSGRNGKNNGKGYYIYEKGSKPKPDPSVLTITRESKRIANIIPEEKVSHMLSIHDHLQFHYTYDYQFVGIKIAN
ncbi:Crotonase superfamily [Fagus crenata]